LWRRGTEDQRFDHVVIWVIVIRFLGRFDPESFEWIAFVLRIRDGNGVANRCENRSMSDIVWSKGMIEQFSTSQFHAYFAADVPKAHQL